MKNKIKICVFAYEFPHFKTEYGLKTLIANGFDVVLVVAQPFKKLSVPRSNFRISPKLPVAGDLQDICVKNDITYIVASHDSSECSDAIAKSNADIGVILGARILKRPTIESLKTGILNIHPGAIPHNRGLDNFKWSIINKIPLRNTAHFINDEIDMGIVVDELTTDAYDSDEIWDLYLRHFLSEFVLLKNSLAKIQDGSYVPKVVSDHGSYFSAVPEHIDSHLTEYFQKYLLEFASKPS
jgi:methionyl-tRNA formyltransferase